MPASHSKRAKNAGLFFCFAFLCLAAHFLIFSLKTAKADILRPNNPALALLDRQIKRGKILDASGEVLAYSDGALKRHYPYGQAFAHLIGQTGAGASGVELSHAPELLSVKNVFSLTEAPSGGDITLTVSAPLQTLCHELIKGRKGCIVALEPDTGKVLALVSSPSFSAEADYGEYAEAEDAPLLNRATAGLYPPGSVFKTVTLVSAKRRLPDFELFTYECKGSVKINSRVINCYDNAAHGVLSWAEAYARSCNGYFALLSEKITAAGLRETADGLFFNARFPSDISCAASSFSLGSASPTDELVETSIGQGKTLVTPLHMAALTAAAANGGTLYAPYVVSSDRPAAAATVFSAEECVMLGEAMRAAAEYGTAKQLDATLKIAGKTGTAENGSGADHGWFTCFAPYDAPRIALCVLLENCGGSSKTLPVAEEIIKFYLG